jgi:hypothetical protein
MLRRRLPVALCLTLAACGADGINHGMTGNGSHADMADPAGMTGGSDGGSGGTGGAMTGCEGQGTRCYTVYAHSDHVLYSIDLMAKSLVRVGPFNAPKVGGNEDVITDLAVAPDNTIYVISKTNLYTADPVDGHVTLVGPVTVCGSDNVGLTTTPDGKLYAADYLGAFCQIDVATSPPTVTPIGTLGSNMALSGDLVGLSDGTVYGTAYDKGDSATQKSNLLVELDPATGSMKTNIGATTFPKLFGVAYALGQVFAFTHDGSGDVITVDPKTGAGTLFNSFMDPSTQKGISFAGAGVNSMVPPIP